MARPKYKPRFPMRKCGVFAITLSTIYEFLNKHDVVGGFYELINQMKRILKSLREAAITKKYLYKTELYVVSTYGSNGELLPPHIHGLIFCDCREVIKYIAKKWREYELGYGRFITTPSGHKKTGNVHIQPIDDLRKYNKKYGVDGWLSYARHQKGKVISILANGLEQRLIKRITRCSKNGYDYLNSISWKKLLQYEKTFRKGCSYSNLYSLCMNIRHT